MPTAFSAAPSQPNKHINRSPRFRRLAVSGLGVLVGLAILLPAQLINAPLVAAGARPGSCAGWNSTTQPPSYIRVLRRQSGNVDRVDFRKYVITVMGKEWPGYLPNAVIEAGAVAVKQYAWFHSLGNGRVSKKGQCFDVTDGVGDQLYKPNRSRVRQDHYAAVSATWNVRLLKHGTLFMTGYRTGNKGRCGHDATGWKLYARSAIRCADSGKGFLDILRIYYGPVAVVTGGGKSGNSANSAAAGSSAMSIDFAPTTDTTPAATTDTTVTTALQTIEATSTDVQNVTLDVAEPETTKALPIGEVAFTAA